MRISIILPTYRPSDYIFECIDSLRLQSGYVNCFEVIVVLNGCKDPYFGKIDSYLRDSKLHYSLIHTDIKGVSNARNIGIDLAQDRKSDYILFLDDDDKLSTSFIADCINKADPRYVILCNSMTFTDEATSSFSRDYISNCFEKNRGRSFGIFQYRCFFSSICAKLIPTGIIGDKRFNSSYRIGEDSLFGFAISKNIKNCILSDSHTVYYRRVRSGSVSRSRLAFKENLQLHFSLVFSYTKIYLTDITQYNFFFFLSRVIAAFIQGVKRL